LKISIIIPCYNIELHVLKCIDSVLNQTYPNFELLLINDGSTDTTLDICKKQKKKDSRIKVYSHNNKGVSFTRNRGIALAKGDYIMFIDGDDWIEKDTLSHLINAGLRPDIINVCGMIHEKKDKTFKNIFFYNLIQNQNFEFHQDYFFSLFPSSILSSPCCKLYNRDVLIKNNIKFDEDLSFQEDLIFNLLYLKKIIKIRIVPYFKYHYIEHEESSSNKFHPNLNKSVSIIKTLLLDLSNYDPLKKSIQHFNMDQVLKLISNYIHKDSNLSIKGKIMEIRKIIHSDFFEESKNIIENMSLRKTLKYCLKYKYSIGIFFYFQVNKLIK